MRLQTKHGLRVVAAKGRKLAAREAIGLGKVDDTPDLEKPISNAVTQEIIRLDGLVQMIVPVHADAGANLVLTNQTLAEDFFGFSSRSEILIDLTGYTEGRLIIRVMVASGSANTPKISARHYVSFSASVGDFSSNIGTTDIECSLAATGLIDSGWIALKESARAGIYLALIQGGGDGVADPEIGSAVLQFR